MSEQGFEDIVMKPAPSPQLVADEMDRTIPLITPTMRRREFRRLMPTG